MGEGAFRHGELLAQAVVTRGSIGPAAADMRIIRGRDAPAGPAAYNGGGAFRQHNDKLRLCMARGARGGGGPAAEQGPRRHARPRREPPA
ncbi:MAG: hypothetical protein QM706_07045 [Nitrospira sp.]